MVVSNTQRYTDICTYNVHCCTFMIVVLHQVLQFIFLPKYPNWYYTKVTTYKYQIISNLWNGTVLNLAKKIGSLTQIFPTISQKLYFWATRRSPPIFPCEIINLYTIHTEQHSAKPSSLYTTKRATAKGQKGANYGLKRGKRNLVFIKVI